MAILQGPSLKQAEVIMQEWGESPEEMERGVRNLQNMLAASTHLPDPSSVDVQMLRQFIRGCRMNMQRARTKLETYFISRSRFRDMYEHISLEERPLSESLKFLDIVPLPKVTDEGYRVTVIRVKPNYPDSAADVADATRAILLVCDARLHEETVIAGDVFIWEITNLRASLAARVMAAANTVRRSIYLAQSAYPQRMKRIHVVGARPFFASSLQFMRSCVNEKIRNRYYIHSKLEDLQEYIPARVLPIDFGGEEQSIESLARQWRNRVGEVKDHLQNLKDICNTTTVPILDTDIYGTVGAFRKLDID